MEKIKDVLYDLSDILLSLLIISLIFVVVSWKISDTMELDYLEPIEKTPSTETTVVSGEDTPVVIAVDDPAEPAESETPVTTEPSEDDGAKPTTETPATPTEAKDITVKIPDGTIGYNIAKILQNNGLISDTQAFLSRVEERGLQTKMRSGTFKFNTADSVDEIINKLTGQ